MKPVSDGSAEKGKDPDTYPSVDAVTKQVDPGEM